MLDRVAYIVTQGVIFNLSIDQTTCLHCGFEGSAPPPTSRGLRIKWSTKTMVTILRGIILLMVSTLIYIPTMTIRMEISYNGHWASVE